LALALALRQEGKRQQQRPGQHPQFNQFHSADSQKIGKSYLTLKILIWARILVRLPAGGR
jgi:hypothetical protein